MYICKSFTTFTAGNFLLRFQCSFLKVLKGSQVRRVLSNLMEKGLRDKCLAGKSANLQDCLEDENLFSCDLGKTQIKGQADRQRRLYLFGSPRWNYATLDRRRLSIHFAVTRVPHSAHGAVVLSKTKSLKRALQMWSSDVLILTKVYLSMPYKGSDFR